jgi:adenine phosphoribosyltransferase
MNPGPVDQVSDLTSERADVTDGPTHEERNWAELVRDVPDFPQAGVSFKDITPVLADPETFSAVVRAIAERYAKAKIDIVLGIEARGFILAAPVAIILEAGFVPARKAGKLPWTVISESYSLEYGVATLEAHAKNKKYSKE